MPHLDHTAFVNACRDERGVGHHTLRAYAQDLRTFARFTKERHLTDPLSKDDILAYHRHLRDDLEAKPATIERRLVTLKSYFAWCADRNSALPSPFVDVRISVRIPRRLPRPIERDTLKAVLHAETELTRAQPSDQAFAADQKVTILMIKLLIVTGLRISELTNLKIFVAGRICRKVHDQTDTRSRLVLEGTRIDWATWWRGCQRRAVGDDLLKP